MVISQTTEAVKTVMLFQYLGLILKEPLSFLSLLPGILIMLGVGLCTAITVHEFSHALIAELLGDSTAKRLGRLSLNPRVHLDPSGTLMLLLLGLGWGKPTPVNPSRLRYGPLGVTLVSIAGPIANLLTSAVLAIPFRLEWLSLPRNLVAIPEVLSTSPQETCAAIIAFTVYINIVLCIFNLLPIAPLDGFKVLLGLLPYNTARVFSRLEAYGPVILIGVFMLDFSLGLGIMGTLLFPPIQFFVTLMLGI